MNRLLEAFTFAQIQSSLTLFDWITQNDKTMGDVREYVKNYPYGKPPISGLVDPQGRAIESFRSSSGCSKKIGAYLVCSNCGHKTAKAFEVNTKPCNQIGGNYTKHIICKNCEHEEFK